MTSFFGFDYVTPRCIRHTALSRANDVGVIATRSAASSVAFDVVDLAPVQCGVRAAVGQVTFRTLFCAF